MVRRDGKVVRLAGYGVANLEHGVRVTPQTDGKVSSLIISVPEELTLRKLP